MAVKLLSAAGATAATGLRTELQARIDLETDLQVVDFDRLGFFKQVVVYNVLKPFNIEHLVIIFWFIQNQTQ